MVWPVAGWLFQALLSSLSQRFASLSRFVETLVVADDTMAAFHGAGLKRYLLTVMAAAAKAFKHPSIRNPVSLVVTRLVVLGPGQEGPPVGPSAAQTLHHFCAWQRGLNTPEDSDPDHFDTAILFTRQVGPSAPCERCLPEPLSPGGSPGDPVPSPHASSATLHRTCVGSPPVIPWAWPTWAPCVTQLGAALSWRTTGSSQPSLPLTNWVRVRGVRCLG